MTTGVFISYSHKDEDLKENLDVHLAPLKRVNLIDTWHDRKILPGQGFADEIDEQLELSTLVLLLISADFIASSYCYGIEMKRALELQQQNKNHVVPIILRACDWQILEFSKIQALPTDGRAVTSWANRDEAFTDIAKGLRRVIQAPPPSSVRARIPPPVPPDTMAHEVASPASSASDKSKVTPKQNILGSSQICVVPDSKGNSKKAEGIFLGEAVVEGYDIAGAGEGIGIMSSRGNLVRLQRDSCNVFRPGFGTSMSLPTFKDSDAGANTFDLNIDWKPKCSIDPHIYAVSPIIDLSAIPQPLQGCGIAVDLSAWSEAIAAAATAAGSAPGGTAAEQIGPLAPKSTPKLRADYTAEYLGSDYWRWKASIAGEKDELDRISSVTWNLPSTFADQHVTSTNREDGFALERTGWGSFSLSAIVSFKDGSITQLGQYLALEYPARTKT